MPPNTTIFVSILSRMLSHSSKLHLIVICGELGFKELNFAQFCGNLEGLGAGMLEMRKDPKERVHLREFISVITI
jgi:hypothetical protein